MKTDIHPKYFDTVEIRCSCGNMIRAGSTKETLKTELCSNCHPFYTGQQKLIDTAGRVDKFQAKQKKALDLRAEEKKRKESKKKKPAVYQEKEIPAEVLARAIAKAKPTGKWAAPVGDAPVEEILKEEAQETKKMKMRKSRASGKKTIGQKTSVKKRTKK